jgi:hypothetical protein
MNWLIGILRFVFLTLLLALTGTVPSGQTQTLLDRPTEPSIRRALLICVTEYNANLAETERNDYATFPPLISPCTDVDRIAARLVKIGWNFDDIEVVRNPAYGEMVEALDQFAETMDTKEHSLGFIYIAAHAIEVQGRPYVISKNAKLDLRAAKGRLATDPNQRKVFGLGGIDLREYYFENFGETCNCDVVLVMDACRDNPLDVLTHIETTLREVDPSASVTRPSYSDQVSGIGIFYAAAEGDQVKERTTTATTEAFTRVFVADETLFTLLSDLKAETESIARTWGWRQKPELKYAASNPKLKFSTQTTPQPEQPDQSPIQGTNLYGPSRATAVAEPRASFLRHETKPAPRLEAINSNFEISQFGTDFVDAQLSHEISTPAPELTKRSNRLNVFEPAPEDEAYFSAVNLDVFWCEGPNGNANLAKAEKIAEWAKSYAVDLIKEGNVPLGRIRVRSLSEATNADPRLQLSSDVIRANANSETETAWGMRLANELEKWAIGLEPVQEGAAGTMSLYFCKGALSQDPERHDPRVFVLYAFEGQQDLAGAVTNSLVSEFNVEPIRIVSTPKLVEESPNAFEVRYFSADDFALAQRVASGLQYTTTSAPAVKLLVSGDNVTLVSGLVEVWIGKDVAENSLDPEELTLTARCSTKETGLDRRRTRCEREDVLDAPPGSSLVVSSLERRPIKTNRGSDSRCRAEFRDFVEGTNNSRARQLAVIASSRAPADPFGGKGWAECEYGVSVAPDEP